MLAASVALRRHLRDKEIEQLRYTRDLALLQLSRGQGQTAKMELNAYYRLFNVIAGTDHDPEKVRAAQVHDRMKRYEQLTGYRIGSAEFDAAVDATVEQMNNPNA